MRKAAKRSSDADRSESADRIFDSRLLVPVLGCAYALIVYPLLLLSCDLTDSRCLLEPRPENKLFWPLMAAIALYWTARHYSRNSRLTFPPHIVYLLCYLALAGASVFWAFSPELSFIRFSQQAMILVSILLPTMLASRNADLMRAIFLCFALSLILNVFFVFTRAPLNEAHATPGYMGYFPGKNYLGEFGGLAFLLSIHEVLHRGHRRILGIAVAAVAAWLIFMSNSKTAAGLALLTPLLAGLTLMSRKQFRVSLVALPLGIIFCYALVTSASNFSIYRLSNIVYGDPTFTGRSVIWDFVGTEISRSPLLGWGYQSFWLVGPTGPAILDAPGWVKTMPNAHNGYLDTILETGYVGYIVLLAFIVATMHSIGRVADRDPTRAWLMLSLGYYAIITNGLESTWMRGFEFMWIVFLLIAAETARYCQPELLPEQAPAAAPRRPGAKSAAGPRLSGRDLDTRGSRWRRPDRFAPGATGAAIPRVGT